MKTICQWTGTVVCVRDSCDYMCCRALLQSYVDSHKKIPGASEYALNALRYVQKNAPSYYKQMFSLIVSFPRYKFIPSSLFI